MGEIAVPERRSWQDCDLVASWLDHHLSTRPDEAARLLADDVVLYSPPSLPHGGQHRGRSAVELSRSAFDRTWAISDACTHDVRDAGDGVVLIGSSGALTARASGAVLDLDIRTLVFVQHARITEIRPYWRDTEAALACLRATTPMI
jgi:ketosteroid isomerase-like protein